MDSYSDRIMNIPTEDGSLRVLYSEDERIVYREGHRDARHRAAEIDLDAEIEIENLKAIIYGLYMDNPVD